MNRRSILFGGFAIAASSHTAIGAASREEAVFDLATWLETAPDNAVMEYHASCLADAMNRCDATRAYRFKIDREFGFALIMGDALVSVSEGGQRHEA